MPLEGLQSFYIFVSSVYVVYVFRYDIVRCPLELSNRLIPCRAARKIVVCWDLRDGWAHYGLIVCVRCGTQIESRT